MAPSRTRNHVDSDGPSTADASANEDVEMQDHTDRVNGFKKFGVSVNRTHDAAAFSERHLQTRAGQLTICPVHRLTLFTAVLSGYA